MGFFLPIVGIPIGTTASDQSWPRSNDHEGVLHILQNFRTGVSVAGSYPSADAHSAYFTDTAVWASQKKLSSQLEQRPSHQVNIHSFLLNKEMTISALL